MNDLPYPGQSRGADRITIDPRVRFSLQLEYRGVTTYHNFDADPRDHGPGQALGYRFEPDDVRAYNNRDYAVLMVAGVDPSEMDQNRRRRREAFENLAGKLGVHALDEIEAAEGWFS